MTVPRNESPKKNTQDIGHCRKCKFQWVVRDGTKGKRYSDVTGKVCPDCKSSSVYYTQEDNR